ncbi:MAG: glycoside hydrolase family 95 protein [Blautia sp.]|nr:glycoside hydrolase family 95 protein [Blautia sp.]MDY5032658.1 glycoside hydrolase N-terminal domain-containing protein [Blautia sp.]
MSSYGMHAVEFGLKYPPMDIEKRRRLLPYKSVSSLYPSKADEDVLVTANGVQRIDIVGDPYHERVIYRRERIMDMRWKDTPEPPDVAYAIPEARKYLREGNFEAAAKVMDKATKDAGYDKWIDSRPFGVEFPRLHPRLHSVIELLMEFEEGKNPHDYLRYLDMMSGEAIVRCEDDNGGMIRRSFVSFDDDVVVQNAKKMNGEAFDVKMRFVAPGGYDLPDHFDQFVLVTYNDMYKIEGSDVKICTGPDSCTVSLAYDPQFGERGYCCCSVIQTDGEVTRAEDGYVNIEGAHSVTILSRTVKYEEDYRHSFAEKVLEDVKKITGTYEEMLEANRAHLEPMMRRSEITFHGDWALAAEELLNEQHSEGEISPMLMEKLYDMGRFFMITDTGEDPPSLFQHNINTNLQVCAGNMTGLPEVMDTYFRFYERKFDDFRLNAQRFYGARGVLGNIHCDYNSGKFYQFSIVYPHYCWTACLGWIYNEFWGHYLVSGDEEFLRERVVPGLKEIALFYEDYLSDEDENGKVLFYPSYSPEDPSMNDYHIPFPKDVYAMNVNSLMDVMVCREVLDNLMEACEILGLDEPDLPKWKALRSKLPDFLMDEDGAIKEWSFKYSGENYDHRHVSHHYDIWPGRAISPEKTPELVKPFILSNRKRGHQDDSAHGVIHRYFTAVRLDDHKDAMHNLRTLMEHGYVTRTLNTVHYPYRVFCPDLLGAMPAMLLEMLVYSDEGFIKLLPSVPEDLSKGSVHGVWLYTFAKIESMEWDMKAGKASVKISSLKDQDIKLLFPVGYNKLMVDGQLHDENGKEFTLSLKENGIVELEFEFAG